METNKAKRTYIKLLSKRTVILGLLLLIILGSISYILIREINQKDKSNEEGQRIFKVAKMDLSSTIAGSGPIISSNRINVISKANGIVKNVYVSEGQQVKAGELLCEFDITNAQLEVDKFRSNLSQNKLTQQDNMENQKKLTLGAPFKGIIVDLNAEKGDVIPKNGIVFTIANTDRMKLTVPIGGNDVLKIVKGDSVNVNIQNLMETIKGKVSYVSDSPYSTQSGGELYNVDVVINNPGSLIEGMKAGVEFKTNSGTVTSISTGLLSYANKQEIRSETGGLVKNVIAKQYQRVNSGDEIVKLQNDEVNDSVKAMNLKIKDLENQLNNSIVGLEEYRIYSPIDGVVSKLNATIGSSNKTGDILAIIVDNKNMEFTIPIDELDIDKIKIGQRANISFDALPNTSVNPVNGTVSRIAVEGEPQNGVTTFPVTIKIGNIINSNKNGINKNKNNQKLAAAKKANKKNRSAKQNNQAKKSKQSNQNNNNNNNTNKNNLTNQSKNQSSSVKINQNSSTKQQGAGIASRLKGGMSANAEILINSKTDVLAIPIEGVFKVAGKSYVMVKSNAATIEKLKKEGKYINVFDDAERNYSAVTKTPAKNTSKNRKQTTVSTTVKAKKNNIKQYEEYFSDCIPTLVEVGINNEYSIEIKSGLKEGQQVVLPPLALKQTAQNKANNLGLLQMGNNNSNSATTKKK